MKSLSLCLILAVSTLLGTSKHGPVPRHFVVEADWLYYRLEKVPNQCLGKIGPLSPQAARTPNCYTERAGSCVMSVDDIVDNFHFDPGLRLVFQYLPNLDWTIEGRFTGCLHWEASKSAECYQSLRFPFKVNNTNDYIYADSATARFGSNLNTGEANFWYNMTPRRVNYFSGSFLFGVRYVQINEKMDIRYTNNDRTSHYISKTWNQMVGPQIAFDLSSFPNRWFNWGIYVKGGLLGDMAKQRTTLQDYNNTKTLRYFSNRCFLLCWMAEVAPVIYVRPWDWLYFRLDYEMFFLASMASAPIQIDRSGSGKFINNNAKHRYQGVSLGVGIEF